MSSARPRTARSSRRDDGPLPTPLLIDLERMRWQAGYRDWDQDVQEYRVAGDTFDDAGAAWTQSQAMVAAERARRGQ